LLPNQIGGSLSQDIETEKRKIAISLVVIDCAFGKFECALWRAQIGVEVFKSQAVGRLQCDASRPSALVAPRVVQRQSDDCRM